VALWKGFSYRYSGEKFDMSWEEILNVFHHVYSKEYERKRRKIRKVMKIIDEVQEYPYKPFKEALMDKLKDDINNNKTFIVGI